jgi:hypothetical protein
MNANVQIPLGKMPDCLSRTFTIPLCAIKRQMFMRALPACFFLLLAAVNSPAQCLLNWYWPMNDGDYTYYSNSTYGGGEDSFSFDGYSYIFQQNFAGNSGYAYLYDSGDQVMVSELTMLGYDIVFDNDLIFLNESILKNGGSVTSSSTGTLYAGYSSGTFNATLTVSASKTGTVIEPAGTYTNCISIQWSLTVSANGQTETVPLNVFVLAPGAGVIRQGIYQASGTTVTQVGWEDLTSGQVGGVPVSSLAPLSGMTVPAFTLQPQNTIATNLGIAVFHAAATGGNIQYQWMENGDFLSDGGNITGSSSNTLVINPVGYGDQGTYSVEIINPVCSLSSTDAVLTVIPDAIPPTVSITAPTSGQLVSNANFTITGTAKDNIGVGDVFYQLNGGDWLAAAPLVNNWSNWDAQATLTPGTNTFAAYAVDTSGNVSTTNSVKVVYILNTMLSVRTNGSGTVSPNLNGQSLAIGTTYSMTATAGTGFMFTNWTGGTSLPLTLVTNGPTLRFVMQSNLLLQANFVDTSKPVVAITNMTSGMLVSNAAFTMIGTATDNVAVASVFVSLSNSVINTGYALATTVNNWANWSTNETLAPGTNTLRAYAVDASGNISTTNIANVVYVVSAILTVSTNGLGSLNPNYNQALLQVGKNYSITATPATGFMFTNWTGGTNLPLSFITNGATVQFAMVSNLMLHATFLDTNRPALSITNLVSGQRLSNAVFTVKGTASDNWQVGNVLCQIDGGGWNSATNINNWTNWSAGVTLVPGTNTVAAYSVDTSGNLSTTSSVSFQYVVTNQLGVRITGLGTISPNYSNAWLNIGQNYSITSAPASGFIFTNWTVSTNWIGGTTATSTNLQFMMQSNLTLQAGFVETNKPTLTITAPTSGQHMTNALATVTGTAGDVWGINAVWYQLTNGILTGGTWSMAATTNSYTNWSTTLTLAAGTNTVKAYAVNFGGIYSATNSMSFVSSNSFELQLAFTNAVPLKTNGLVFSLQLSAGLNGHIQVSTNLTSWATLTNFVGTNTTLTFRDPAATNFSRRFYRAVIP